MSNTAGELGRCDSLRKTWQVVSFWGLPAVVATIAIVLSDRRPALFLAAGAALGRDGRRLPGQRHALSPPSLLHHGALLPVARGWCATGLCV